ncbi:copper chaperone PCu(A)C [Microbispora sp. NPDC049125]|uniref:copper chaperone PCu(A)C n=1 Tax=Microbispora sp. NPDC049125 TaxID=3154929 RepID=UPI003467E03A
MTSSSRRRAIAVAAFLAAIPAMAACGAGFDANTNKPYSPNEAGVLVQNSGSAISYGKNGVMIPQAFILGPDSGSQIAAGGSAPLYLTILNKADTADALTGITTNQQQAASVKVPGPIQLTPGTYAKTPGVTVDGVKQALLGGETLQLTLQFKNAGDITIAVPVIARSREFATLPAATQPAPTPSTPLTGASPSSPVAPASSAGPSMSPSPQTS